MPWNVCGNWKFYVTTASAICWRTKTSNCVPSIICRNTPRIENHLYSNMNDRKNIHDKAEAFFENLWRKGDPWELETSTFEQQKYGHEIQILHGRHYRNVLEIGCGAGTLTRRLAPLSERLLALDISPVAISRARAMRSDLANVDFLVQNIMEFNLDERAPWDLIVMNEMIYY